MPQKLIVPKSVAKSLGKIPLPWRKRIFYILDVLPKNPFMGEKMWGKLAGKRKIRVWPYRIIYIIDNENKNIIVVEIAHRGSVGYK